MAYKKKTKKIKRQVDSVVAHVTSTFNNTLVSITTMGGDVLLRGSAGKAGFKGARKGTPFAASQIGSTLAKDMQALGVKTVEVNLQGPGSGRDSVVRAFVFVRWPRAGNPFLCLNPRYEPISIKRLICIRICLRSSPSVT